MGQQVGEEEEEQKPSSPWDFAIEAINPACPIIGLCPLFRPHQQPASSR